MSSGIKPLNDWQNECKDGLQKALQASVEIMGRNGAEACKHAIILMAQSAAALTKQSPKNRKPEQDPRIKGRGGQFVRVFKKTGEESKLYRLSLENDAEWQKAKLIANRGLAKRSWMWGLSRLDSSKVTSRPIPGVGRMININTSKLIGYILQNALSYIVKILPAGWEFTVAEKASNKIMKQAKMKIEREYLREMRNVRRGGYAMGQGIQRFFVRA